MSPCGADPGRGPAAPPPGRGLGSFPRWPPWLTASPEGTVRATVQLQVGMGAGKWEARTWMQACLTPVEVGQVARPSGCCLLPTLCPLPRLSWTPGRGAGESCWPRLGARTADRLVCFRKVNELAKASGGACLPHPRSHPLELGRLPSALCSVLGKV